MDLEVNGSETGLANGRTPSRWTSSAIVPHRELRASVPPNPAELLAQLMDFPGSVALAKVLHAPAPVGDSHPEAGQLAAQLHERVRVRLDAQLPVVLRPLTHRRATWAPKPDAPRRAMLPKPPELLQAILATGAAAGQVPDAAQAQRLAREVGAPLRAAFGSSLRQLQAQFAGLRMELAHDLGALGPRAARLERIDAALQRSIQRKVLSLFERLQLAAELSFERACLQACATLPENFGEAELEGWAAEGGWIARERALCERVARSLFRHQRRNLQVLLLAATHAEAV